MFWVIMMSYQVVGIRPFVAFWCSDVFEVEVYLRRSESNTAMSRSWTLTPIPPDRSVSFPTGSRCTFPQLSSVNINVTSSGGTRPAA